MQALDGVLFQFIAITFTILALFSHDMALWLDADDESLFVVYSEWGGSGQDGWARGQGRRGRG